MAAGELITFRVWDSSLAPKTDALAAGLAFSAYRNRAGVARTQPTIERITGNLYGFEPTTNDVAEGIAYAITTGTGGFPARYSGAVYPENLPFAAFLLTNQATGALWAGAAPTVGAYVDADGNARSSSLATVVSPYLFAITPSAADLALGVTGYLTMPVGADPSPAPSFSFKIPSSAAPATGAVSPSPRFPQVVHYAEVSGRDTAARVTLGPVSTTYARVQSTHDRVTDQAGEVLQANYKLYFPPSCPVTTQHRVWLTSEGDSLVGPARRVLKVAKLRDGIASDRFHVVYAV